MSFFIDYLPKDNLGTNESRVLINLFISNSLEDCYNGFFINISLSVIVHFF